MLDAKIIPIYFKQLTTGCGNQDCFNVNCASCPSFKYDRKSFENANIAAAESIKLCNDYGPSCLDEYVNSKLFLTESIIDVTIDKARKTNEWNLLREMIKNTFSSRQNLSSSFLKKGYMLNITLDTQSTTATTSASATPKSSYVQDDRISIDNSEITLDYEQMKSSIKKITANEDELLEVMGEAVNLLCKQINQELQSFQNDQLEADAHFLNIFFILFHLPYLSDPSWIFDCATSFYTLFTRLSINLQAKFVRVLSQKKEDLRVFVSHVQQYITMHTIRWSDHEPMLTLQEVLLSSEKGMHEGVEVLRLLYYANLIGSERDENDTREKERENRTSMDSETAERRDEQNPNDLADNENDGTGGVEFSRSANPTTPLTPHRQRFNPLVMDTTTNDSDELEMFQQNPLQIKLDIEPSEFRRGHLPFDEFVNECANEKIDVTKEYLDVVRRRPSAVKFSFIFYPFSLSTSNKTALLNIESKVQMYHQRRSTLFNSILSGIRLDPVFKIHVRRDHLIEDALVALEYQGIEQPSELKKQLFVQFEGEQGHDEGGLSKEFFQLITEQIFSPEYGMFVADPETRSLWFNPSAEDVDREYTLIGMLLGLAIYNSIILDIKFPPVLYRKLLGKLGSFEDLETSHPTIYRSLKYLLSFDEQVENATVEDAFGLTFEVGINDATGSKISFILKPNGQQISVTAENRQEFVRLYSDLILNKSVVKQFHPFFHGFSLVTRDSSLRKLFRPDEIDLLVAGSQQLDFSQLASAAEYDGGYSKESQTIKNFWAALSSFTEEQKRKFLRFTTGSDRAPIGGLGRLKLIISRNGPDTDRLPTAHTCFNAFLLPDYSTFAKLREKLLIAIDNAEGFGLL